MILCVVSMGQIERIDTWHQPREQSRRRACGQCQLNPGVGQFDATDALERDRPSLEQTVEIALHATTGFAGASG